MKVEECFQLGYFVKSHGINGELILFLDTDFPERYINLESVFVEIKQKLVPFFINQITLREDKAIVKLDGIDSIEQSEVFKSASVYLPLNTLPVLEDDQFYYHEIIGFQVTDETHGLIGPIVNVYEANGNDLLSVDHHGKEVLIPIQNHIFKGLDKKEGTVQVKMPDGLLDIYLNP